MTPAPSPLSQLEAVLRQMIVEHEALLRSVLEHEAALRSCSIDRIEKAAREQDACRQRITAVESRRRVIMHQIARQHRTLTQPATLTKLAEFYPDRRAALTQLRTELTTIIEKARERSALIARVAQSVLGHVNATLRLVAHAAAGPGTYTRQGGAPMPPRMGVLNAVA